ncbi:MAG: hypothetical protein Q4A31_10885 [Corynebacterium sp.]|uniref:hypothetical protein n=1 Tax=Corynebacterium sp. TaxID=1720 RepID=UPI0026DBF71A|nr:hypothetical protein [Corynebacterium sp.]MDO4762414.1 hypothetical protein [Corynebacterium sp.]
MPLQHLEPFSLFRRQHFTIGGSPSQIGASAQPWREVQQLLVHGAGELSAVVPEGFEGNVGLAYRQNIGEALPAEMKAAADIAERIAQVYTQYADDVAGANAAMDATKLKAEAIHQEVNVAVDCVNKSEDNMSIANSMGQPVLIAAAKSALDASMAFYEVAKWSWDQCLQQAQEHKNDLRSQVQAHESILAGVVANSRLGAVQLVKPPRELSFLRVILSELIEVAGTVGKIMNHLVPAGRTIRSLSGVDEVAGEIMTAADQNVQRQWSSAFEELIQLIHRAERQAAKFIVLYREADLMNEKDLANVEPLIEGLFQSILADDKRTKVFVDAAMSLEERINHLGTDSLLWDPYLGEELNPQVIAGDIRRMNSSISGPFSINDEAVERNQVRGRNLDDLARILTQTSAVEGPFGPGTTSRIISLPSVTAVADDYAPGPLQTPGGNYFAFTKKGLPIIPKGGANSDYYAKVSQDGTLTMKVGEKGYEKVYPRVPKGKSSYPSVIYEAFDADARRQIQYVVYPNGMIVEYTVPSSGEFSNPEGIVLRPRQTPDGNTPLSYAWTTRQFGELHIGTPEHGDQHYYPAKKTYDFSGINKALKALEPIGVVAGNIKGVVEGPFEKFANKIGESMGADKDAVAKYYSYAKKIPLADPMLNAANGIVAGTESIATGSSVPLASAMGSNAGGLVGGALGVRYGSKFLWGKTPWGRFLFGAAGTVVGSHYGQAMGADMGRRLDDWWDGTKTK